MSPRSDQYDFERDVPRLPRQRPPRKVRMAGDYVSYALKGLGVPSKRVDQRLHQAWHQVCEEAWRPRTELRRFEGGVLEIGVSSAPLCQELSAYHADRLRDLLRASLDGIVLVGLRFVAGSGDHTPAGRSEVRGGTTPRSSSESKTSEPREGAPDEWSFDAHTAMDPQTDKRSQEGRAGDLDDFDFFAGQE